MRERADRAGQLADADHRRARASHAFDVAIDLGVPQRQLQPEGHRLGVHAVRAADHRRPPVLERRGRGRRRSAPSRSLQDEVAGLAHLQRLRGVDDVGRGHAEVQPARRRTDVLGHRRRERDDVVLGDLLDFFDAGDVEARRARGCRARPRPERCRRRPSPRPRRSRPAARSRSGAGRSRCAPSRGACSVESSQSDRAAPRGICKSVDVAEHGRRQRAVPEQIARRRAARPPAVTRSMPCSVSSRPNCRSK